MRTSVYQGPLMVSASARGLEGSYESRICFTESSIYSTPLKPSVFIRLIRFIRVGLLTDFPRLLRRVIERQIHDLGADGVTHGFDGDLHLDGRAQFDFGRVDRSE